MEQSYFLFTQRYYKLTELLGMSAPTHLILAEVYMQYMEQIGIYSFIVASNNCLFEIQQWNSRNLQSIENKCV
jgi:hypothetical protein